MVGAAVALASACLPAAANGATYQPAGFQEQAVVTGLTIPTTAAWAPDGRLFVAEKSGVLKVVNPGLTTATTILDISDKVNDSYDRGLLGMALDTDFESNGYLYLLYVYDVTPLIPDSDGPMVSTLTRVQVSGSNTVSQETVLLGSHRSGPCQTPSNTHDCIPADNRSHSIGTVISAPDGTLYLGSGDASSFADFDPLAFRVYNEQSFAGKIMRVDREGRGVGGHPFCPAQANLELVCTKLHSKGFRNPFRFELRGDGTLTVGDVGWSSREEVDFISAPGRSYGWPCYEGTIRTPTYQDEERCSGPGGEYSKEGTPQANLGPVHDYQHTGANSVIGGPAYPGGAYPDDFDGDVLFGDFNAGFLKRLELDAGGAVTSVTDFATGWAGTDLMLTPDGDLAYTDYGTGEPGTGSLKRIVYAPGGGTPNAVATADPTAGGRPLTVDFSSAGSIDPDGDALSYEWDFDDGSPVSTEAEPTHTYTSAGVYDATLTVDDGDGHTDSAVVTVSVFDSPPTPTITSPADGSTYRDGDTISVQGAANDPEDGALPASALSWTVILHHGAHTHRVGTFTGTASPSFAAHRDHDADSYYEVRLRATDSDAEWGQTSIELRAETAPLTLDSVPSGAPVSYSGIGRTAPFSTQSAIGLRTTVSAGARFTKAGRSYQFDSWTDGGGRLRELEIPESGVSLTAVYHEDKAFGRPPEAATASSVHADDPAFAASKAIDDDPSTRWSSKRQSQDPDPEWQVDLGSLRSVSALELDWEHAFATRYEVLTSVDGIRWSLAAVESNDGAIRRRTRFPVRAARFVKVHSLEHSSATFGSSFFEARVLGPPDSEPVPGDKAAGRPTSSSSALAGLGPSLAADGDSATRWASQPADDQWWQVDLESARAVDTIELNWEDAYAPSYEIQTSLDGVSFDTAASVAITEPGLERTTFPARVARYVRVRALQRALPQHGVSLWDVRVFGGTDPPDTTPPDTEITAGPDATTAETAASFAFASESDAAFECSIDRGGFEPCASPRSYDGLAPGAHSFAVRARDPAGNLDPTPAAWAWTIAPTVVPTPPPTPPAITYRETLLGTPGLLGYWHLGDRGVRARTMAGTATGRYAGGPKRVAPLVRGTVEGARRFDGRDDRVTVPAGRLGRPAAITVELWVTPGPGNGRRAGVLATGSRTPRSDGFSLLLDHRRRPLFAVGGTRGRRGAVTGPALKNGRTYHLAGSYDGRTLALYVNGRRRASRAHRGGIAYVRGRKLRFGAGFRGVLDEIALYGSPLGGAALAEHFRLGTSP